MGEGARRCAHPSRLSTWQPQFACPSLTLRLPGARSAAEPRPTRGRGPPGLEVPCPCIGRGRGPQAPLSRSSATQEGTHPPSSLGSWWAGPRGGGEPPQCSPSLSGWQSVSPSGEGGRGLRHTTRMRAPQPPAGRGGGAVRAGGGGGVGDSAALRPPPRNFAAAGAAVATGTESFCSPMSGLPWQAGGWEATTPR